MKESDAELRLSIFIAHAAAAIDARLSFIMPACCSFVGLPRAHATCQYAQRLLREFHQGFTRYARLSDIFEDEDA